MKRWKRCNVLPQQPIDHLVKKMGEFLSAKKCNAERYSQKYMKQRMDKHFKDRIVITELEGKANVINFSVKSFNNII